MSALDDGLSALNDGFRPEPSLPVSDWSDRYRMLSGGAQHGHWRTDGTPYLREAADFVRTIDWQISNMVAVAPRSLTGHDALLSRVEDAFAPGMGREINGYGPGDGPQARCWPPARPSFRLVVLLA
jgi:hypothetical protein